VKFTFVTGVTFTLEKARVICVRCSELTLTELELTEPVDVLVLLLPLVASRLPSRLLVAALPLVPVGAVPWFVWPVWPAPWFAWPAWPAPWFDWPVGAVLRFDWPVCPDVVGLD
jgi:hypothetical protein